MNLKKFGAGSIVIAITLGGCTKPEPTQSSGELPSTATAVASQAEGVVAGESTSEQNASLQRLEEEIARIDATFPRPPMPGGDAPLFRVASVERDGQILLDSGALLRMDGMSCSSEGIAYISRLLTFQDSRVAYRATGPAAAGVIPAEIWLADIANASPTQSPSYSLVAETALTSGWCSPVPTASGAMNERHLALAELAVRRKQLLQP